MKPMSISITGIGSVTPFGPLAGLIPASPVEPSAITSWATDGLRRAFLVNPFQPASVVPGLKTRRLDRLSAWAMVAASLALKDSGIDLEQADRSRIAVVFATGSGCIELTADFYQSALANGWSGTDPITFPETLANSPAGHVALFHNLRGPNITVSSKHFAGETALLHAASLLRNGQANVAVVIAGDTLSQPVYEWYETAHLLSTACFHSEPYKQSSEFMPSEGVVGLVLEVTGKRKARSYANLHTGRWTTGGEPLAGVRTMLGNSAPNIALCAGNGAPCDTSSTADLARQIVGPDATILPAQPVALGITDTGGLLHLVLALSAKPEDGLALMLATSQHNGYAAILLEFAGTLNEQR